MSVHLRRWGDPGAPKLIAIHGFADDGGAFERLGASELTDQFELVAPDLPGFGASPLGLEFEPSIAGYAGSILEVAQHVSPGRSAGLIAHSVGSAIAVAAAFTRPDQIDAVFSIEGNLTTADAYFSGQATDHASPQAFKSAFDAHVEALAAADAKLARYRAAVQKADPGAMWRLGRDAARQGREDQFGRAFLGLKTIGLETRYFWGRHNTPTDTARFVDAHPQLDAIEFGSHGHWVFEDAPHETAEAASNFFTAAQS